jgi:ribonuclease BN (tRNA processing enzyme)
MERVNNMNEKLKLIFLGTNGWYSTPVANTMCALIKTPERYIVLDAGDGIWRLDRYVKGTKPVDVFLSHFHLDHTIGLHIQPKFRMMKNKFRVFGMPGTKKWLDILVNSPFTASYSLLRAQGFDIEVNELKEGENKIDEYMVRCAPLVHADPCWGFRFEIEANKRKYSIAYCTDTGPCENLILLAKSADALITECSWEPGAKLTPSWPHLNPQEAAKSAKKAKAKQLFLTHFAANKYQTKKSRMEAQMAAKKIFPKTIAAMDGMEFELG